MGASRTGQDDILSIVQDRVNIHNPPRRRRTTDSNNNLDSAYEHRFHYKPLDRSKGAVRLIRVFPLRNDNRIRCRIERHHIATAKYTALSYVWGPDEARKSVLLNGRVFRVRPNLFSFLRHVAKNKALTEELYWVDAICINQFDLSEKNGHVRHMGSIYSGATRVIAWLGSKQSDVSAIHMPSRQWTCCQMLEADRQRGVYHDCTWKVPNDTSWEFILHEYWNRLWIAQELSLATRVDILWQRRFYNWFRLRKHLSINMGNHKHSRNQNYQHESEHRDTFEYIRGLPIARYLNRTGAEPLSNLVPRFCFHECQIGHDHVFALLAIASDGSDFEPDYSESSLSLLLRLLVFCYPHPTVGLTTKIGTSFGIQPADKGTIVDCLGLPQLLSNTSDIREIYYRPVDDLAEDDVRSSILVRIPDVNLHFLFRSQSDHHNDADTVYAFVSRVVAVSPLVEQAKSKFGQNSKESSFMSSSSSQAVDILQQVELRRNVSSAVLTLCCNWPAIVRIYELSYTVGLPGRLESRIRSWKADSSVREGPVLHFVARE